MSRDHASPPPDAAAPDGGSLHQAALNHLARYATTQAGLRRVLLRRIDRWARLQPDAEAAAPAIQAARQAADAVISRLAERGPSATPRSPRAAPAAWFVAASPNAPFRCAWSPKAFRPNSPALPPTSIRRQSCRPRWC